MVGEQFSNYRCFNERHRKRTIRARIHLKVDLRSTNAR
ncbi:hypothetical protein Gotri_004698 [Gossypium trilobum]|uniref:Uncharacterized protein n=1 Tax=Gossypium trilobum TaxID=34281 RepID=A0A7J9F5P2_9ROSI|nr:hypothetical protein [Gossypium trilobum]